MAYESGEVVTLNVDYRAYSRPEFQWFLNDRVIEGANSSSYTFHAVDQANEGSYSVEVRTPSGVERNVVAVITIRRAPPEIISQPERLGIAHGAPFSIHVKASGSKPLFYQWYFNDLPINGATSDTHRINAATESAVGTYTVEVRNRFGTLLSQPINVTLDPAFQLDWRSIGQSWVATSSFPLVKSGYFYWSTSSRLQTTDLMEWMPMSSRVARLPVFADGTYWSFDHDRQLMRDRKSVV